ncbi:MAG TPA: hypothetical protein VG796_10185 [Verrucomicrobiales bacterium]|jgi:hypothetical protein|nr:hypothetical protein [Verrucomicrobiales bacterium]
MKHLITALTVAIGALVMTPTEVQARTYERDGYYRSDRGYRSDYGYRSDRGDVEIRKVRRLVGYTKYGRPIYRWRTIVVRHKPYGYYGSRRYRH